MELLSLEEGKKRVCRSSWEQSSLSSDEYRRPIQRGSLELGNTYWSAYRLRMV